jgi:DNA-binding transcriptional LysR family regulator
MVKVSGRATANSVGMLARFAKEGMGIARLTHFLAVHPGFGDGLVRVLSDWKATPANLFALSSSELQPKRVRKLVSFLKENFEVALNDVTAIRT